MLKDLGCWIANIELFALRHEPGASALFILALCLLVGSLVRFLQDIRISLSEHDIIIDR